MARKLNHLGVLTLGFDGLGDIYRTPSLLLDALILLSQSLLKFIDGNDSGVFAEKYI